MRQDVTAAEALRMVLDATPVLGAETVAIAAAYTKGLKIEPGWRLASTRFSWLSP